MEPVFRNHIVMCGWNRRAAAIVSALQELGQRPILILHENLDDIAQSVGKRRGVFLMGGNPSDKAALLRADVGTAYSVLVLALDSLGDSTDARSVQIALAVERIRSAVFTVVELRDIQNKAHFGWTKVDDLITDQEIAVRMLAQGVRHVGAAQSADSQEGKSERHLVPIYRQLIDPTHSSAQIFRVDLNWQRFSSRCFHELLAWGVPRCVLPLAWVGFKVHRIPAHDENHQAWVSWKSDVYANPPANVRASDIWKDWPGPDHPLGLLVLANSRKHAESVFEGLR
ncbi:MAG: NAD-binding protein [Oligoflexia bacterium]|nr:NAD-binding protein [Oligoflexia bacterium]